MTELDKAPPSAGEIQSVSEEITAAQALELEAAKSRYAHKIFKTLTEKPFHTSETLINRILEWAYGKAMNGMGVMRSVESLADSYLKKHPDNPEKAASALMLRQSSKAAVNAFCTNFGGVVALPATLPIGLLTGLYIQLRMIAVMAVIGGYDVHDPRVKTLCYVCLAGNNAEKIFRSAGMKAGGKVTAAMFSGYVTSDMVHIIHRTLGTQAIAHFSPAGIAGRAGVMGFGRFVPVAGGFVSAAWASYMTRQIGKVARDMFIEIPEDSQIKGKSVKSPAAS